MQVSKSHDGIKAYEINPETGLQHCIYWGKPNGENWGVIMPPYAPVPGWDLYSSWEEFFSKTQPTRSSQEEPEKQIRYYPGKKEIGGSYYTSPATRYYAKNPENQEYYCYGEKNENGVEWGVTIGEEEYVEGYTHYSSWEEFFMKNAPIAPAELEAGYEEYSMATKAKAKANYNELPQAVCD